MPTKRTYGSSCGIARALDMVAERWALLIVRELLLGPRRFVDLQNGLATASPNLIADRLRELEGHQVIHRRKLPPPASSWVYELTEWGRELEPIVIALGVWGTRAPLPPEPVTLSSVSAMLALRTFIAPNPADPPASYRMETNEGTWSVRVEAGHITIHGGDATGADVTVRSDPRTLIGLVIDPSDLETAITDERVTVDGDLGALRRLLAGTHTPVVSSGNLSAQAPETSI